MTVDPILPLSISVADGGRSYALFLGSGISKSAGIPTGGEILTNTKILFYKMENEVDDVELDDVEKWFNDSEYKDWGYSEILENLYPSLEDRRSFLEQFFIDKHPTEAHNIIAEMVEKNLIKCIITTNFDKLMEEALKNRGISFDVVASINDINEVKPREHSNCRILKLHGDYQKFNIKNTVRELEKLDDELEEEFKDILNKFGLVVIGYSGADNGVMDCFENRNNPRYTLYWLLREKANERVEEIIHKQYGKRIIRASADEFLEELLHKIEIFQTHETGETPEFLIKLIKEYVLKNDSVSLIETLKKQMKSIREKWQKIYNETDVEYQEAAKIDTEEAMKIAMDGFKEFELLTDVINAIGLVLIEYNSNDFFKQMFDILKEIFYLSDFIFEDKIGSYSWRLPTRYIPRAALYNIFYTWGAKAIKNDNFYVLKELLNFKIIINDLSVPEIYSEYLWDSLLGDNIATFNRNSVDIFDYLLNSYEDKEFLIEFFMSNLDFSKYLYQFSFLLNLYSLKIVDRVVSLASTRLDRRSIRKVILPLLFRIKTEYDFNCSISGILDDFAPAVKGAPTPKFIEEYPGRCKILNEISQSGFHSNLPENFFDE